jgi:hypothetical protein
LLLPNICCHARERRSITGLNQKFLTFGFEAFWDFETAMSIYNSRRVDAFVATEFFSKATAFGVDVNLFSAR